MILWLNRMGAPMREMTFAEAVREALREEMQRDERVFILGEDVGVYGGAFGVTRGLLAEFGEERVRDTPISESAIAGAAAGAALTGMRPVAEIMFMDFTTISMDSQSLETFFCHVPGLKVVAPSTPADAKGLLKASIRDDNPVIFVEHKLLYKTKGPVPDNQELIPLGTADVKREGDDLTIIAYSNTVRRALEAAAALADKGIHAEVLDPRTLSPLDEDTILASVKKTGRALIAHEAVKQAGFGAEIAARIAESDAFDYLDAPIKRLGGTFTPIPYNPNLERAAVPQAEDIVAAANALMESTR